MLTTVDPKVPAHHLAELAKYLGVEEELAATLVPDDEADESEGYVFSARSLNNMAGIHPDLFRVLHRAIKSTPVDFIVTEGLRSKERQRKLVASGASQTMNSRHLTGHAFDVAAFVDGEVRWDWPLYERIAGTMKEVAAELGVDLEWGGDWQTFKDGPHFQLSRKTYPA